MAGLSLTTVVFSLLSDCPSFVFYILEVIVRRALRGRACVGGLGSCFRTLLLALCSCGTQVNVALVAEVGIRFVAFGRQFWSSWCVSWHLRIDTCRKHRLLAAKTYMSRCSSSRTGSTSSTSSSRPSASSR